MDKKLDSNIKKLKLKYIFLTIVILFIIFLLLKSPSNNRNWNDDQKILSSSKINDNQIEINNIRNFSYKNTTNFEINYYNKTFNLQDLETLDYVVEELDGFPGFAHTLLTFGFKDGSYLAISVEIRKEEGESYNPISGFLKKYEIMYVIADERDVINLRANYRNDTLYLYPIKISKKSLENLFITMLEEANSLTKKAQFYNTFTSTCTTNLAKAASSSTKESFFQYHPQILLPGYSDDLLLNKNLINTNLTEIEEVREHFKINEKARKYQYSDNFSYEIRH